MDKLSDQHKLLSLYFEENLMKYGGKTIHNRSVLLQVQLILVIYSYLVICIATT